MNNTLNDPSRYCAFIGIDWADKKHDIHIMENGSKVKKHFEVQHHPKKLTKWFDELGIRYNHCPIAVAIETSRGPLINFLVQYPFLTLFPVNPLSLSQYRKSFRVSSAIDDVNDSDLLCEMVATHLDRLSCIKQDDQQTRELRLLSEQRRKIVQQRVDISNALKAHLKQYFPLAIELAGDEIHSKSVCEFLLRFPTHELITHATDQKIRTFYRKQRCWKKTIDKNINIIRNAKPLTTDSILTETMAMTTKLYAQMLLDITNSVQEYDDKIHGKLSAHPDGFIFKSLPGAGSIFASRITSVYGCDRSKFNASDDVQKHSGVAPITQKSGNKHIVMFRIACPKFIRQTFVEFAKLSIQHSIWARAFYTMKIDRGKTRQMALRALAFKWIRIITKCWKERKAYDELIYLKALQKRKSPILKYITATS